MDNIKSKYILTWDEWAAEHDDISPSILERMKEEYNQYRIHMLKILFNYVMYG